MQSRFLNVGSHRITLSVELVLILLMVATNLRAAEAISRDVVGHGDDERAAILDGLVQAIEQVNGVRIEHKTVTYKSYTDAMDDLKQSFKSSIVGTSEIKSASRGLIDSYEVHNQSSEDGKRSRAEMTVTVSIYDPKDPIYAGKRKIIAVIPFHPAHAEYQIYDAKMSGANLLPMLSQGLVKQLVQSRKFTVLDRDFLADFFGEQKLIQAGSSPPQELLKLGQQLGADFLLVGTLDDADATAQAKTIELTRRQVTKRAAKVAVGYRVLNVATGKIHWADTFRHTYGEDELRSLSGDRAGLRIEELLMEDASAMIADQVITAVYPIRILKVIGDEVILNQGGLRTGEGEEFDVFNQGEMLFDPDTNEPLERVEQAIARVRVTRITNKVAYAKLIAGAADKIIPASAVCRRALPLPPAK